VPDRLDQFLGVLRPFGIREQARTGAVYMSRGPKVLNQRTSSATDRKYLDQ
jgi:acetolactate synthase small subunit